MSEEPTENEVQEVRSIKEVQEKFNKGKKKKKNYVDFYGPVVLNEKNCNAGVFHFKEYQKWGHVNFIGELILILLFGVFIAFGVYNFYHIALSLRDMYIDWATNNPEKLQTVQILWDTFSTQAGEYRIQFLIILGVVAAVIGVTYLISLLLSFFIVRLFSKVVTLLMIVSVIFQIGLLGYLYWAVEWEYNWIFLLFLLPDVLMAFFWRSKFKKAIRALKMGSLAVSDQGWQLLKPQVSQTFLVSLLAVLFTGISFGLALDMTPIGDYTIAISSYSITITGSWIYFGCACLFVFLVYMTYYVTQGMKMLMIHHWYRGGGSIGFWRAYGTMRYRWWALLGYAFSSTIIHMLQYAVKAAKGEFGPKNIQEAFTMTGEIMPDRELSFRKKKGTPWYERIWMGINTFTLPAIAIEKRLFHSAIFRSVYIMARDLSQIYIKETHIKRILLFLQYVLTVVNTAVGAIIGYALARYLELDPYLSYILMGGGGALFLWIAGSTVTLIMDDVNLAYITVLFIISIDEINKKENFTIDNLEKCDDGSLKVVINTDARESKQGKKKDKKGKEKKKKGKKSKDKAEPQPTPEIAEVESKSDKKKNKKKKK